jgi:drug/metabolite transporter (DMT)-like permease
VQRSFNRAMLATDATIALPFNFSRLIWAALFGWLVFTEVPDVWTWAGGTLIFVCSVYIARITTHAKAGEGE